MAASIETPYNRTYARTETTSFSSSLLSKKFGFNKKAEWFVEAYDKTKDNSSIFTVNIKNICVQTEYYTFHKLPDDKKRFLEKFYALNIETEYPRIYELLTNTKQVSLSAKQRFAIISFVISQVLRTSKLANQLNYFWNQILEKSHKMMDFEKGIDKIHFEGGGIMDFKDKTLDQVKREQEKENIETINLGNLERFYDLTYRRLKDGIAVKKIHPSFNLITSDNPAYFDHNIYDPTGFIRLPLDESHLLMILPHNPQEPYFDPKMIVRSELDKEWSYIDVHYNNIYQIENSERYIIGKKQNIESALLFFKNLDPNDFYEKTKALNEKAQAMLALVEKIVKP